MRTQLTDHAVVTCPNTFFKESSKKNTAMEGQKAKRKARIKETGTAFLFSLTLHENQKAVYE